MIIQHTTDKNLILFTPEDLKERRVLSTFPGLSSQGHQYFCANKQHVLYNLYQRLSRKLKSFKFTPEIKEMIEGDIVVKELPASFKFHTQPLKHQLIALRFAYTFGSFLNLSEPGLGKTKVTLDYIWLMQAKKSLIVCPKSLRFVWEEEAVKHRPELSVYVVETTDWGKELPGVLAADVVVVNYDKAVSLEDRLKALQFDFMAVDEGLIKNPTTERTKALTRLSKGVSYRCVMSGTLVNNSPLDVFAPLRFIEPSLVGDSFYKFQQEYAVFAQIKGGSMKFVTGYRKGWEVKEMLGSCGVIMTKKEWLTTLPAKEFIHKYVQMGDKQRDYYQKLASNYLLQIPEIGAEIEVDNPLSVLIKLNQISNGFVYYKENTEETLNDLYGTEGRKRAKDTRKVFFFEEQPKVEALLKLIQSEEFNDFSPIGQGDPDRDDNLHNTGGTSDASGRGGNPEFHGNRLGTGSGGNNRSSETEQRRVPGLTPASQSTGSDGRGDNANGSTESSRSAPGSGRCGVHETGCSSPRGDSVQRGSQDASVRSTDEHDERGHSGEADCSDRSPSYEPDLDSTISGRAETDIDSELSRGAEPTNNVRVHRPSNLGEGQVHSQGDGRRFCPEASDTTPTSVSELRSSEPEPTATIQSCGHPSSAQRGEHSFIHGRVLDGDRQTRLHSGCYRELTSDIGAEGGSGNREYPDALSQASAKRGRRAIIWFNLSAERDILEANLTKAGISFLTIAGGNKVIGDTVRRFNTDPTVQFLLCQAKTINYGVTIMGTKEEDLDGEVIPEFDPQVSDEIFYSLNFSLEVFLQQQDRIHRIGQTRKCRYWLILTNSKIERRIATRLEEKLVCNKEILVDIMENLEKDMLES